MDHVYYIAKPILEATSRRILTAYDSRLFGNFPSPVPIEEIIESMFFLNLEYQHLSENQSILGKTIFEDGYTEIYDKSKREMSYIAVRSGTIIIDGDLCCDDKQLGRYRFTCAHELAHWILHKNLFISENREAAMRTDYSSDRIEWQADYLGASILMPLRPTKLTFYHLRNERKNQDDVVKALSSGFQVSKQAVQCRLSGLKLV